MASLKEMSNGRKDIFLIRIDEITGFDNIRPVNQKHVIELANSIAEIGQQEPVWIRPGESTGVTITRGQHRYEAIKYAREKLGVTIDTIMAICEPKGTNEETRIIHQIVENDGLPLQPLELAAAFKKLTDYCWTIDRISKSTGKSRTYITETIGLLGASRELRKAVEEKKVSPTAARTLAKASPEKQRAAVEEATATGKKVTVQQAQRETTGKVTMFSAKAIRDAANQISAMLNSNNLHGPSTYWEGVRTGLQIAMGDTTIAEAIDQQKTASIAA